MASGVPVSRWLNGELRDWAEDLLDSRAANEIKYSLTARRFAKGCAIWTRRISANKRGGSHFWDILVYLNWIRRSRAIY
ncbi:MAG: hypothetical protein R3F24_13395 [Gammaproteobacteria bacterium]